MMMIGCEPNKVGAMATGVAPLDPIFWVLHSGFEKAQHIVQLSPGYRDTYDFEWIDSEDCDESSSGGRLADPYPFTGWWRKLLVVSTMVILPVTLTMAGIIVSSETYV